ncbi:MAG: uridine kinase [Anaerolineae bacterium]|nr:uridine kinase [Anaerolineae bacterium]
MSQPIQRPVTIGVAGGTASGKSTVSARLLEQAGSNNIAYLSHDSYYRDMADIPRTQDGRPNFDHPDSLETSLLIANIRRLQNWEAVEEPVYDFTTYSRTACTRTILPQPVILVEGILLFVEPELRNLFDIRIFVDTPDDIRLIRRLKRDIAERGRTVESVIDQYLATVRPMHLEFVEPSKRYADVIIPEGGFNQVAIDIVAARIRSMLADLRR